MTDRLRRLARGAAIAVGVTAVAGATHRLAVRRIRGRVDPIIDPLLVLPEDIVRHDVPSHDGVANAMGSGINSGVSEQA